jgi:CRISPR-associated protein Csd1
MILQALYDYYQRKAADPEGGIAPEGFEWKEIPFLIVINREGRFVTIQDTREGDGKNKKSKEYLVPQREKKASGIKANLLWDNAEYALGANSRGRDDISKRHAAFQARLNNDLPSDAPEVKALMAFLVAGPVAQIQACPETKLQWKEILESNHNLTFRLEGSNYQTICETLMPQLLQRIGGGNSDGLCLVTGERAPIARLHASIAGVRGAQSSGASLVSFNLNAFKSFGKDQNHNAPVGEAAAFAYTTALNHLLGKDSKQKLQVGDATTIFWSERKTSLENHFAALFGFSQKDDPDAETLAVKALYESTFTGSLASEGDTRFFVLGLAPNAARISVRFWHQDTLVGLSKKLRRHLDDLEIVLSPKDPGHRALMHLLCSLVLDGKADNVPPNLAGTVVRAILSGGPYPQTLLHLAVRRIRAERTVTRARAAVLKAVLNRALRQRPTDQKEITVSLDLANLSPGYRLGRLFAVLEKIQEDAQPGINTTIRDRFYGAASSSPASVFPQLLKLKNHHLAKLSNPSFRGAHEKRLGEIFDGIVDMPPHLAMEEQARFAIGYYHQRQTLFTKSAKSAKSEPETQA